MFHFSRFRVSAVCSIQGVRSGCGRRFQFARGVSAYAITSGEQANTAEQARRIERTKGFDQHSWDEERALSLCMSTMSP